MSKKGSLRHLLKNIPKDKEKEKRKEPYLPSDATATMEVAEELHPPHQEKEQTPISSPESWELPQGYGETRIVAMARDPYWLFVYWEVSEGTKEEICSRFGGSAWEESRPVLRLYDVTSVYFYDSDLVREIAINDYADNWYIDGCTPGRTYCVELGRVLANGAYIFVARSNLVTMPRDRVSEVIDSEWLLPVEYEKLVCEVRGTPGSPEFLKGLIISREQVLAGEYVSSPMSWVREEAGSPLKW
ncbi:MAG: DUF4912 domain-containing protein [Thermacetogeniaceae bacterium]